MKAPIFLDHSTSYHPLPHVIELLHKVPAPHAFSPFFQSRDRVMKYRASLQTLSQSLGAAEGFMLALTAGKEPALEEIFYNVYFQEMFHSGRQHIAVLESERERFRGLEERLKMLGISLQTLPVTAEGHLTKKILQEHITPRTAFLSLSFADPLTGIIQPALEIAQFCHERKILCHLDISHALGKLYFNLRDLPVDYVSLHAPAFHGPQGVTLILAQQRGKLRESEPYLSPQLEAVTQAVLEAGGRIDEMNLEIARLRHFFEAQIVKRIPMAHILFQEIERLPHVSVIAFPYIHGEYLLYLLAEKQLYASIGGGEEILLATLLQQRGAAPELAHCALSFSFSYKTTQEEVMRRLFLQKNGKRLQRRWVEAS